MSPLITDGRVSGTLMTHPIAGGCAVRLIVVLLAGRQLRHGESMHRLGRQFNKMNYWSSVTLVLHNSSRCR